MGGSLVKYEQNHSVALSRPLNLPCCSPYGIPPSEHMIPGKTYVGRLPGHTRKAFVRKRPSAAPPVLVTTSAPAPPPPIYAVAASAKMGMFSRARRDGYYVSYGPSTSRAKYVCTRVPDVVYTAPPASGRTATTVRQTCAACGRFRSARWEATHPLTPGMAASTSICARCQHDHTSSEERERKPRPYRRSNHHCHSRHCTDKTEESYCSLMDRRSPRRYRSDSREYSRPRASSRDNVRIVIANQPNERPKARPRRSSSLEGVRVVRRTSIVEVPERVRRRSRTTSSSRAYYLNDGTAQYVEDLRRPHYRSRSRSLSRASYVEELEPIPRHKRRSSSRVQFVDDLEEPVLLPRPRRISRRRAVYFDGPASFEASESEERGRSRPPSSHHEANDYRTDAHSIEETVTPRCRSLSRVKRPGSENEFVEEEPSSHRRLESQSTVTINAPYARYRESLREAEVPETGQNTQHRDSAYDTAFSDNDRTPRPAFRSISASHVVGHAEKANGHKRTYSRSADSGYRDRTLPSNDEAMGPHPERSSNESATSQNKRLRRYRDDSTEDEHRPVSLPVSFRHVPAPSSPDPYHESDYLSQMLSSSHITPPSEQKGLYSRRGYARGPPSPPRSRSTSRSEDSAYRPPVYRDDVAAGVDQYSPVEDLYGNKIGGFDEGEWGNDTGMEHDWMY